MTDPVDIPPEGPDMSAAELALGVLEGDDYRAAAARLARDDAFAGEVAGWEARLGPLAAEVAPVKPPATVWPRIAAQVGSPQRAGVWDNLGFWRGATVAGMAVAAVALVMVALPSRAPTPTVVPTPPPALQPVQVAKLSPAPGKPATVVATLDFNTKELVLTSVNLAVPPSKSAELWVIPIGQDPISLGVMDPAKPYRVPMPAALQGYGLATSKLAVTLEQPGGSPDKKPHGPIVTAGTFA